MAKVADIYFNTGEWGVSEYEFNEAYAQIGESVFSLGNEYMGIRGFFEEGYSGNHLIGSYFNGIYEQEKVSGSAYKGIVDTTEFMVNSVNWLYTRIRVDGESLDLHKSTYKNFERTLDFKSGVLKRSFEWTTQKDKVIKVTFERLLSMTMTHIGCQKITFEALQGNPEIDVTVGADFSELHQMYKKNYWNCVCEHTDKKQLSIMGTTQKTNQQIYSVARFLVDEKKSENLKPEEKRIAKAFLLSLKQGEEKSVTRIVANFVCRNENEKDSFNPKVAGVTEELATLNYSFLKEENKKWWGNVWEHSDIEIKGDELNQQGIRFCIFQMFQTYLGANPGNNIGAKGLTGEAYNGNAFWDTETYCLPFYIFNNKQAAKNLLYFRYMTLNEAEKRAEALDCKGAFYPIATISGRECCNLWQHASLQLQASTAVAYGVWFYVKLTKDYDFLRDYGIEMLIQISRMLATRGDWSADGTYYGYYGVMGPDEFQLMVNHDCYTNYMGKFTLEYTLNVLEELSNKDTVQFSKKVSAFGVTKEEMDEWKTIAKGMYIPHDEKTRLFEQHYGFFQLPHVDVDAIPIEDFPLYSHWTYDRIYRNDMIKQPDVLMFMFMFPGRFSEDELRQNYDYYEPKCIHESSLSPSVHSILASSLKKHNEAYEFFKFATRMDLDNYNRNSHEGLHTTSIAAAWMNIVYGFGGMRSDGDTLSFCPSIPKEWEGYSFRITYENAVVVVNVQKEKVSFEVLDGKQVKINVYGKDYFVSEKELLIKIPDEWRG